MTERELLELLLAKVDENSEKLRAIENKVEMIDLKQDLMRKKFDNLELDIKVAERDIKRDMHQIKDTQDTIVAVLQGKDILPKAQ